MATNNRQKTINDRPNYHQQEMDIDHSSGESLKERRCPPSDDIDDVDIEEDEAAAATCDDIDMEDLSSAVCDGPDTKKFRDTTSSTRIIVAGGSRKDQNHDYY